MSRFSSKSSLLAGVSALVLATAVSSGAVAADIVRNFRSDGTVWASGLDNPLGRAQPGDNLQIQTGGVRIDQTSRGVVSIGILKGSDTRNSNTVLLVGPDENSAFNKAIDIGSIVKTTVAVDLKLYNGGSRGANSTSVTLRVASDAHIKDLTIDLSNTTASNSKAEAVFSGDLTVDGLTEIKAGNNAIDPVNATLELKGDATFTGGVTLTDTGGGEARIKFSGTSEQEVNGVIKSASGLNSGAITVDNAAGVIFKGNLGELGDNNGLNKLTLVGHSTSTSASKATFEGNLYLGNGLEFGQNTQITLNGTSLQTVGGNLTSADGGNYGHIIIGSDTNDAEVTFTGALGASGTNNALDNLTLHGDSTATFGSNVYLDNGLTLGNGTVTFNGSGDQTVDAAIANGTGAQGSVTVESTGGTVTFEQAIGANGAALQKVTLTDGKTIFEDAVHAKVIDVDSADGTTFDVAVTSDSFTLSGVAQFKADVTVNEGLRFDGSDGSAVFIGTNRQSFSGAITATPNTEGTGRIVVANEDGNAAGVIFNDDIGASNAALKAVVLNNGTTTFKGKLFARGIDVNTAGTTFHGSVTSGNEFKLSQAATFGGDVTAGGTNGLRFNGANGAAIFDGKDKDDNVAAQTVTGKITTGAPGQGTITVNNAQGVTFAGQLGATGAELRNLTVNQNAKVTFNEAVYLSGTLTLNTGTTIALGDGLIAKGRDATQAFITAGSYSFGAGTYDDDDSKVKLILPVTFTSGEQTIFSAHNSLDKSKFTFAGNNLVNYKYNFSEDGTAVTVTAKGFKSPTDVESAAFSAVKSLPDSSPIKKLLQEAAQTGNEAKGKTLAEQLKPQTTALSGAATAVVSTGTQVAGVFTDRLSVLRGGETLAQRGFATGGHGLNKAFWLKPFGSWGKQTKNTKQNVAGYSTTAKGLAVGVDAPVTDKVRVGTALAYSTSNIKGKGAGKDNTDVKSWQVSLYGDYSTARYYVEGQLGLGRNDVSTASKVAFLTRKADYDTTSVTASVGGGVPLNLNATTTLTPTAGLAWTRVGSANYTTTGASVLNQKISVAAIDAVVGTLGTQLQRKITRGAGTLVPTARVGLSYDFAGKPTTASGKFTGGGDRFKVKGAKVKKLSGTAGLGLTYAGPRWSIGADYDLTARTGYQGHTARVNAKVKF